MRRVIGMDIHRTFAEVVAWEEGRLRPLGRADMTRSSLEGFGKRLQTSDEVVVEASGSDGGCAGAVAVRPAGDHRQSLQVKAIAYAHVKTDKIESPCGRVLARGLDTRCQDRAACAI